MALSADQVRHIAKLAKLKIADSEIEGYTKRLGSFLEYTEMLSKVDTRTVTPTNQVTGLRNVTRPDEVCEYPEEKRRKLFRTDASRACPTWRAVPTPSASREKKSLDEISIPGSETLLREVPEMKDGFIVVPHSITPSSS